MIVSFPRVAGCYDQILLFHDKHHFKPTRPDHSLAPKKSIAAKSPRVQTFPSFYFFAHTDTIPTGTESRCEVPRLSYAAFHSKVRCGSRNLGATFCICRGIHFHTANCDEQ
jgi:hypothetical protein